MGKFIKIVLIIYVIYYAVMIIFDLFIKKSIGKNKENDGINLQIEGFETKNVDMTEEELAIEKKLEQDKILEEETGDNEDDEEPEESEPVKQEGIEMELESQGFTIDQFSKVLSPKAKDERAKEAADFLERIKKKGEENNHTEQTSNSL